MKIKKLLNEKFKEAFNKADINETPLLVTEATKPEFGNYQFNGAMALSKKLKKKPREIAQLILDNLDNEDLIEKTQIAGPGFINIWLNPLWVAKTLKEAKEDIRLGISKKEPLKVVIDYSGPNMAKEMHVGHLRSTIIGDALVKLSTFLGDEVIKQNHIGDWGTQFGMLVAYLDEKGENEKLDLKDLESFYKEAKAYFDKNEEFANKSRAFVVKIQNREKDTIKLWEHFISISLSHCEEVYNKLEVSLLKDDVKAESFYNDDLPVIIEELTEKGLLEESQGAKCLFLENEENPMIVQKSDGGYLYATTDLSAIKYRAKTLKADKILYVVDARQGEHFKQLFKVAKKASFIDENIELKHIAFGTMLNKEGKPFKTRDGGTVKLIELLDEAVLRAKGKTKERTQDDKVAQVVGIGAIKYADLSINRESNYIFDWDKMLSLDGNTSLYLQYAYARVQNILKNYSGKQDKEIILEDDLEKSLGVKIIQFEEVLLKAYEDSTPHYISSYLYELVTLFMRFYEQKPILKDEVSQDLKESRIQIAILTADTIKLGLEILGIKVVDRI